MSVSALFDSLDEWLQAAQSISPGAELKLNASGQILDWNTAAARRLHMGHKRVLGCSLFDLLAPDDPFKRLELLKAFKHAMGISPNGMRLMWPMHNDVLKLEFYAVRNQDGELLHVSLLLVPELVASAT